MLQKDGSLLHQVSPSGEWLMGFCTWVPASSVCAALNLTRQPAAGVVAETLDCAYGSHW